jgi:cell shape-determining protein MreC
VKDFDLVLSSGQGLIFPEGFCLGRIKQHELKEKELYHKVVLEPLVNLQTVGFCLLLKSSHIHAL